MPDYDSAMRKLAGLQTAKPYERVYGWRQVLDSIWRAGFEAVYTARDRDMHISDRIAEQEAQAVAERTENA